MKALAITDRALAYKVECARYSYVLLSQAWGHLRQKTTAVFPQQQLDEEFGIEVLGYAWQIVDFSMRFVNVMDTIPRFSRKDPRYGKLRLAAKALSKLRNFIQHVDRETHRLRPESYPILGALAWASVDGAASFTVSLGSLPPKTYFHTVSFDTHESRYLDEVLLGAGDVTLKLNDTVEAIRQAAELLHEWLESESLIREDENHLGLLVTGAVVLPMPSQRYTRVKVTVN